MSTSLALYDIAALEAHDEYYYYPNNIIIMGLCNSKHQQQAVLQHHQAKVIGGSSPQSSKKKKDTNIKRNANARPPTRGRSMHRTPHKSSNRNKRVASNSIRTNTPHQEKQPRLITRDGGTATSSSSSRSRSIDASRRSGGDRSICTATTGQPSLASSSVYSTSCGKSTCSSSSPSNQSSSHRSSASSGRRNSCSSSSSQHQQQQQQQKHRRRLTKKQSTFNETYELIPTSKPLGHGIAGQVHKCYHRSTSHLCAVKVIHKATVNRHDRLKREMSILKQLHHPNIIRMYDCYETEDAVHIVTELCEGGELFDRIIDKARSKSKSKRQQRLPLEDTKDNSSSSGGSASSAANGTSGSTLESSPSEPVCFNECEAATIIHQLLQAISYLHSHDIIHRDIKPENILFVHKDNNDSSTSTASSASASSSANNSIKLIDFGLSTRHTKHDAPLLNSVGTSYYMSPEVLSNSYDRSCDLWSVGVITYIMLCGKPPFNGDNDATIFNKIRKGMYKMDSEVWNGIISNDAKDFINCLLCKDVRKRWTADMALEHDWLLKRSKSK